MSKFEKLKDRLLSEPTDFTWSELVSVLSKLGFKELQGKGSRVRFYDENSGLVLRLHKPHPTPILKSYMIKEIVVTLTNNGYIKNGK